MTTQEVIKKCGVSHSAAVHWAQNNGVYYIGEGKRKIYLWNEADLERFSQRRGRGWVKGRPRKG